MKFTKHRIAGYANADYNTLDMLLIYKGVNSYTVSRDVVIYYATEREGSPIRVKYHDTDVLSYEKQGDIYLDAGGWYTNSTRMVMNSFLPREYNVITDRGKWYVTAPQGKRYRYYDGIWICPAAGTVGTAGTSLEVEQEDKAMLKRIKNYAALYTVEVIKKLIAEAQEHGTAGDCWYCSLHTQAGETMGDLTKNREHLLGHMEDEYVMASLLKNAYEDADTFSKPVLALLIRNSNDNKDARHYIERYLKKRLLKGVVQVR